MTDVLSGPGTGADPGHDAGPEAERLRARLEDPQTASSLNTLLDNLDGLAFLAEGLNGLLARGDTITESLASGVHELRGLTGQGPAYLIEPARKLADGAPQIADAVTALLESGMLRRDVVDMLGTLADAAVAGVSNAQRNGSAVDGVRPAYRALRDPDVARGLGVLIEIARAIGKQV